MSTRDSTFSYVHIDDPNQVLYMERWRDDPIPFDDIETQALLNATANLFPQLLLEEEEEGSIPISSVRFGAKAHKNRDLLREKVWSDLGIFEKFLNESSELHNTQDNTILKPLHTRPRGPFEEVEEGVEELTIGDFLSNGYVANDNMDSILSPDMVNDSMLHQGDISLNSTSDMIVPGNNTFLGLRSGSNGGNGAPQQNQVSGSSIQTPRIGRTRQSSTDKNFQTPITRIMR